MSEDVAAIDTNDDYETFWHGSVPNVGRSIVVTRQEWSHDLTIRHVYAWHYADDDGRTP